jgi:hypothetical protein
MQRGHTKLIKSSSWHGIVIKMIVTNKLRAEESSLWQRVEDYISVLSNSKSPTRIYFNYKWLSLYNQIGKDNSVKLPQNTRHWV